MSIRIRIPGTPHMSKQGTQHKQVVLLQACRSAVLIPFQWNSKGSRISRPLLDFVNETLGALLGAGGNGDNQLRYHQQNCCQKLDCNAEEQVKFAKTTDLTSDLMGTYLGVDFDFRGLLDLFYDCLPNHVGVPHLNGKGRLALLANLASHEAVHI